LSDIEQIVTDVLDISVRLHRDVGPGMLESFYETILAAKLSSLGYVVERQKALSAEYDSLVFEAAFRIDLLVEERLLIEVKSMERLNPAHTKQLLTYLRLSKQPLGLLINFGGPTLMEGFRRVANNYEPVASSRRRVNP
jgi:iron complex transport system substrate-binding protein